jgi:protein phosphatase
MATTLVALLLADGGLVVGHVGDSRAYVVREGALLRLTRDDSLVQELLDRGLVSTEQAAVHPGRSVVLRTINGEPVEAHVSVVEVADGERLLVCSDGLTDAVDEATIARLLAAAPDPGAACAALLDATLAAGAPDNVTCVVGDVHPAA